MRSSSESQRQAGGLTSISMGFNECLLSPRCCGRGWETQMLSSCLVGESNISRAMEGHMECAGSRKIRWAQSQMASLPQVTVFTNWNRLDLSITDRLAGVLRAAADRCLGCDWETGTSKVGSSIA